MLTQITNRFPSIDVLYCCESGSRMWGFASDDSDYDVRFIYKQSDPKFYLELYDPPETIEFTVKDDSEYPVPLDFSGWDIKKALRLAMKSNVSLYEWTKSPIHYHYTPQIMANIVAYTQRHFSLREMSHHYLGLATSTYKQHLSGTGEKTLKKFLYVIRPLLAVEYMETFKKLPPIVFEQSLYYATVDATFKARIKELLDIKMNHPEMHEAPADLALYFDRWIISRLSVVTHDMINTRIPNQAPNLAILNQIFQESLRSDCGVATWKHSIKGL